MSEYAFECKLPVKTAMCRTRRRTKREKARTWTEVCHQTSQPLIKQISIEDLCELCSHEWCLSTIIIIIVTSQTRPTKSRDASEENLSIESDVISIIKDEETAEGKETFPTAFSFTRHLPICSALLARMRNDFWRVEQWFSAHRRPKAVNGVELKWSTSLGKDNPFETRDESFSLCLQARLWFDWDLRWDLNDFIKCLPCVWPMPLCIRAFGIVRWCSYIIDVFISFGIPRQEKLRWNREWQRWTPATAAKKELHQTQASCWTLRQMKLLLSTFGARRRLLFLSISNCRTHPTTSVVASGRGGEVGTVGRLSSVEGSGAHLIND